jgi:hypothetical protein|nr:MAG TPA: hypothetical protein [Caudoviricetes sp.]
MLHPLALLGELVLMTIGAILLQEGTARPTKRSVTRCVLMVMVSAALLGFGATTFCMSLGWLIHGFIGACVGLGVSGVIVYIILNATIERNR